MRALGATFARDENADALDHFGGRTGSLGKKHIGAAGAVGGAGGSRDDHRRQSGLKLLGAADKLIAIHLRHVEITEQEVEGAGNGLLDDFKGLVGRERGDDAVSAGLKQEGSDGQRLFVIVYTKDRLLRPQGSLASAGGQPSWLLRRMGQTCGSAGLRSAGPDGSGISPPVRAETSRAQEGLSIPRGSRRKRQKLSCLLRWGTVAAPGV